MDFRSIFDGTIASTRTCKSNGRLPHGQNELRAAIRARRTAIARLGGASLLTLIAVLGTMTAVAGVVGTTNLRAENARDHGSASTATTAGSIEWPRYEIIDLGDFGGDLANGHGINDAGHTVGTAANSQQINLPFVWRDGALVDLGTLMPDASSGQGIARAISENGLIAGSSVAPFPAGPGGVDHAFFWSKAEGMIDLTPNSVAGSIARGVNDAGQVVGEISGPSGGAFVWSAAGGITMISLPGAPAGFTNMAEDINESGQVCGQQFNADFAFVGWVYDSTSGDIAELPSLGGISETRAINDAGDIVGASSMKNNQHRPVLWTTNGDIVDLGFLPVANFTQGIATGINNNRWIVGSDFFDGSGVQNKGWLWIADVKTELLTLIEDPAQQAEWSDLLHPMDINSHGEIVGIGIRNGVPGRAFLMRPLAGDAIFVDGFDADRAAQRH
jgi:probable HAF family extracellular repeat protein